MCKIYSHAQNSQPLTLGIIPHLMVALLFVIALSVVSKADASYECTIQEDATCIVYLEDVLPETATIDDALLYCDHIGGEYIPEQDICHLEA